MLPLGRRALAAGTVAAILTVGGRAAAQDCQRAAELSTCIAADTALPHPGAARWFRLAPTESVPGSTAGFGLVVSYLSRPVGLTVASADPDGTTIWAVDNAVVATYLLAVGVSDRVQLGLAAPTVLYQDGAGIADVVGSDEALPRSAFGDLRFGVSTTVLERAADDDGPALAGRFEMSLPTGNEAAFVSNGGGMFVPGVVYDHRLERLRWGADVGVRIRPTEPLAGARIGSQLATALGVAVDILPDDWLAAGLEATALFTLAEQYALRWDPARLERVAEPADGLHVPAEWMLSARSAGLLDGRLQLSLGGGSFVPTGDGSPVTVPRFRFALSVRYVPGSASAAP